MGPNLLRSALFAAALVATAHAQESRASLSGASPIPPAH